MKKTEKFMCMLTSAAISAAMLPAGVVSAQSPEDPDLESLAQQLGAYTDHLDITSYDREKEFGDIPQEVLDWHAQNIDHAGWFPGTIVSSDGGSLDGTALGISIIEILTHNGVLSPSDIADGASQLNDITLDEQTNKVITAYQLRSTFFDFNYYLNSRFALTLDEQLDELISTAEKCMSEGRYFLITCVPEYPMTLYQHSVAGIGIADGSWEFGGKEYDKCILTLDAGILTENSTGGYDEQTNIYINSTTHECTIPAYANDEIYGTVRDIAVLDNDSLLNNCGFISPTSVPYILYPDEVMLHLDEIGGKTNYSVRSGDDDAEETDLSSLPCYRSTFLTHGSRFSISTSHNPGYAPAHSGVTLSGRERFMDLDIRYAIASYLIDRDSVSVSVQDGRTFDYWLDCILNSSAYNNAYYKWYIEGSAESGIDFRFVPEGIIMGGSARSENSISVGYEIPEDWTSPADIVDIGIKFTAAGRVLVTADEDGKPCLYIDPDGDGTYDTPVQKGDANCDGLLDAADASAILKSCADKADRYEVYLSDYADINGDGLIDAADASLILSMNAETA